MYVAETDSWYLERILVLVAGILFYQVLSFP